MNEREPSNEKPLSEAEKSGLAKKKAINKAASYFSDDDSLFEFEGFEIETLTRDIDELNKKDLAAKAMAEETSSVAAENTIAEDKTMQKTTTARV